MPTFQELQAEAKRRWEALTNGDRPWVRIGTALCGEAAGAPAVLAAVRKELAARNLKANVSETGCFGPCYAEPLLSVQMPGRPRVFYGNVTPEAVPAIVESHVGRGEPYRQAVYGVVPEDGGRAYEGLPSVWDYPMMKQQKRIAMRNAGTTDPTDIYQYMARGGFEGLHRALTELTPEKVVEEVTKSGLRGRGGAAFPTGTKWSFLARGRGVKYVLCNAEEGDPGAFNDKTLLDADPFMVLEGVALCGFATGAARGYVLIRHGHDSPIVRTWVAIDAMRATGFLGHNILGSTFSFDIEIAMCGDSYVSGEETALMETIEGKRAWPRFRPPFPAAVGLFGKPSNINNVKTLAYTPEIVRHGGAWFAQVGTEKSKGTVLLCFSGPLKYTGTAEVPLGLNLKKCVEEVAGGTTTGKPVKFLQTGGPLGGVISFEKTDLTLDFDVMVQAGAMLGSGGIIAADAGECAVDLIRNLVAFCQLESCGKCFPCRTGMSHLLEIIDRIARLDARPGDRELMERIGLNMQAGSLCGHGQLGFGPVRSGLRYFAEEFNAHIVDHTCPTGKCKQVRVFPDQTRTRLRGPADLVAVGTPIAQPSKAARTLPVPPSTLTAPAATGFGPTKAPPKPAEGSAQAKPAAPPPTPAKSGSAAAPSTATKS